MLNITIPTPGRKYSEMIIEIAEEFDDDFSADLNYEEVFKLVVEAWNLSNIKSILGKKMYQERIKSSKAGKLIEKMVEYKLFHFKNYTNMIYEFKIYDDKLKIKSQTIDDYMLNSITKTQKNK